VAGRQISAVVLDIGGVLLDWDPRHLYRKLIADQAEMEDFLGRICTPRWHRAHDLGADTERSCLELARLHPARADLIMAWAHRGEEMVAGQIDGTAQVLADLKAAGVPCYALSNMEADRFALRRARFGFFGLFDGCVISGTEGVAKPDREIFQTLLARYDLSPASTVFVDDQARNVAAARDAGMIAIEFTAASQLRRDLHGLGLGIEPGLAG